MKQKVFQIVDMPIDKIADLIMKETTSGKSYWSSDIAMKYNLDFDDVIRATNLLRSRGIVKLIDEDYDDYGVVWP